MKPRTRCMMWVRPSYRTYAYNLDVGEQYYSPLTNYVKSTEERGHHPGALTFSERLHYKWAVDRSNTSSQSNYRCNKLDSIQDCSSSTVRHEAKRSSSQEFEGHGGYYAKQYADSKHESLMTAHQESLKEGRRSMSQAVRRAEQHASASGRDPRHVLLPRDKSDDICKKVADLRMTPIEGRDFESYREATIRGRIRVNKLEKELDSMISNSMSYKSNYLKSARQMAKEAYEAAESESQSSRTYRKTTIVDAKKSQ